MPTRHRVLTLLVLCLIAAHVGAQNTGYDIDILGSQDCALAVTLDNESDAAVSVSVSQDDVVLHSLSIEADTSVSIDLPAGALSYRVHTNGDTVPLIRVSEAEGCHPMDSPSVPAPAASGLNAMPRSRAEALLVTQEEYVKDVISHLVERVVDALGDQPDLDNP